VWLEAPAWFAFNDPGFASPDIFGADELENIGVGNLGYKLPSFFTFFVFLFGPFPALFVRFILALVDDFLNLLFFLCGFPGIERLVSRFQRTLAVR
jgi:hypothetical protein